MKWILPSKSGCEGNKTKKQKRKKKKSICQAYNFCKSNVGTLGCTYAMGGENEWVSLKTGHCLLEGESGPG
jgi:hypothetical protein